MSLYLFEQSSQSEMIDYFFIIQSRDFYNNYMNTKRLNSYEKSVVDFIPKQMYFTLKECCQLKNVNYKTVCNKTYLQPNQYEIVGGRKQFRRDVVISWLFETDQ